MLKSPKGALTGVLEEGEIKLYGGQTTPFCPPTFPVCGGEMQEGYILTQTFEEAYYIGANLNGH